MAAASKSNNDVLELNVGGRFFTCLRSTLCSDPDSMLAKMFDVKSPFGLDATDSYGRIFIDRDGDVFATIVEYLRHGQTKLLGDYLSTPLQQEKLRFEAEFYGLKGLVDSLNKQGDDDDYLMEINVGGTIFSSLRSTLVSSEPDSVLAKLLDTNPKDPQGRPFIDRDPMVFEHILRLLRGNDNNTRFLKSLNEDGLQELQQEAAYYGLNSVIAKIQKHRFLHTTKNDDKEQFCFLHYKMEDFDTIEFHLGEICRNEGWKIKDMIPIMKEGTTIGVTFYLVGGIGEELSTEQVEYLFGRANLDWPAVDLPMAVVDDAPMHQPDEVVD